MKWKFTVTIESEVQEFAEQLLWEVLDESLGLEFTVDSQKGRWDAHA